MAEGGRCCRQGYAAERSGCNDSSIDGIQWMHIHPQVQPLHSHRYDKHPNSIKHGEARGDRGTLSSAPLWMIVASRLSTTDSATRLPPSSLALICHPPSLHQSFPPTKHITPTTESATPSYIASADVPWLPQTQTVQGCAGAMREGDTAAESDRFISGFRLNAILIRDDFDRSHSGSKHVGTAGTARVPHQARARDHGYGSHIIDANVANDHF